MPNDREHVRAYYAALGAREWERLERPHDGAVEYLVTIDALERHLPPNSQVLDIGGGPGRYAIALAQRGHLVTLADLSPELVSLARDKIDAARVADRIAEVVMADACDLSRWADASFDAALSLGPLYHLTTADERSAAARELARVVKPGGVVFVAAMPRLAFLRRTIALPDERHHLEDPEWLRRVLDEGIFENEVPGRFSLGYGAEPGEIEGLLEGHGFAVAETLAAESLSLGVEHEVGEMLAAGDGSAVAVRRLMIRLAGDARLLGSAGHLLLVAQRRSNGSPSN